MITTERFTATKLQFEDPETGHRFVLLVDTSDGIQSLILTFQRYSKKQKCLLPEETLLSMDDPEELSELTEHIVRIIADSGAITLKEENE